MLSSIRGRFWFERRQIYDGSKDSILVGIANRKYKAKLTLLFSRPWGSRDAHLRAPCSKWQAVNDEDEEEEEEMDEEAEEEEKV